MPKEMLRWHKYNVINKTLQYNHVGLMTDLGLSMKREVYASQKVFAGEKELFLRQFYVGG